MYTTMRTWTDRSGQFRVEAALLGVSSGSVRLRTADGRTINVSLDALSQSDQLHPKPRSADGSAAMIACPMHSQSGVTIAGDAAGDSLLKYAVKDGE
jgi:hypothetical protein